MKKNLFISQINSPMLVESIFIVEDKQLRTTKLGDPYVNLRLTDKTGSINAKIWKDSNIDLENVPSNGVVYVKGRAEMFNDAMQIVIEVIEPVAPQDINPSDFIPSLDRDPGELLENLRKLLKPAFSSIYGPLLKKFFADRALVDGFKTAPAAAKIHHAYIGGLLEHTLGVVKLCRYICEQYTFLDQPLLLTGAFFHDIGKIKEFRYDWKIDYSDEGKLIGHIVLGVQIVDNLIRLLPSFPSEAAMLLRHLILSHHGEPEMGSVKLPMTREAMALHLADDLDAKMASLNRIYEEAQPENRWTEYQKPYSRSFFLPIDIEVGSGSTSIRESPRVDTTAGVQLSMQGLIEKLGKNS